MTSSNIFLMISVVILLFTLYILCCKRNTIKKTEEEKTLDEYISTPTHILPTLTNIIPNKEIKYGLFLNNLNANSNKLYTEDLSGYIILNKSGTIDFVKENITTTKFSPIFEPLTKSPNGTMILQNNLGSVRISLSNSVSGRNITTSCKFSSEDVNEIKTNKYKLILTNNGELRFADSDNKIIDKYPDLFPILNRTNPEGCNVAI